jgi:phasin family protein
MARKTTTTGNSKPRGPRVTRPSALPKPTLAEKPVTAAVKAAPKIVANAAEAKPLALKAEPVSPAPIAMPAPEPSIPAPVEEVITTIEAAVEDVAAAEPSAIEQPLAPPTSTPISKGMFEMAAPEKIQTIFTDMSDRAKAAFEKSTKLSEDFADLTKGNLEAIAESAKIAAKNAESLAQEASDYSKKSFETASAAMKRYTAVKSPVELIQLNSEYAKSSFDAAIAEASKVSETLTKMMGDMFQPLSSRYAVASEKLKAATAF